MIEKAYSRVHGGDIYRNNIQYDFSINLNPLGMPDMVENTLKESIRQWSSYPDPECEELCRMLAEKHCCSLNEIVCGNGAADLLYQIVTALKPAKAVVPMPAFSEYEHALRQQGCEIVPVMMRSEKEFRIDENSLLEQIPDDTDIIILCNPNNPNGLLYPDELIVKIADICQRKKIWLLIDECFLELSCEEEKLYGGHVWDSNVIRLRAFTKTYAMAGLRLGYALIHDSDLTEKIKQSGQPWNVSVPAQIAGQAALKETEYLNKARKLIRAERKRVADQLTALGIRVFPSDANYLLFYTEKKELCQELKREGILIRDCANYQGLGTGYYRVCIREKEENEILLSGIRRIIRG